MKTLGILGAALLSLCAVNARADEVVILEQTAGDFDTWATRPNGQEQVLDAISRETNVPVSTLQLQREQTGLGYGGLFIANSLASATGKTFDEIAALKADGHGWGWIAKQNNVKLGPIVSKARNANKPFRSETAKVKKVHKNQSPASVNKHTVKGRGNGKGNGPKGGGASHSKGKGKGH